MVQKRLTDWKKKENLRRSLVDNVARGCTVLGYDCVVQVARVQFAPPERVKTEAKGAQTARRRYFGRITGGRGTNKMRHGIILLQTYVMTFSTAL